jgi:hypothetical protein
MSARAESRGIRSFEYTKAPQAAYAVCGHPSGASQFLQCLRMIPMMIPIWIASEAVRRRSREISFSYGAAILAEFGLPPDGPHYRRLIAGFKRIFTSTIFFGTKDEMQTAKVWECSRSLLFRFWGSRVPRNRSVEIATMANPTQLLPPPAKDFKTPSGNIWSTLALPWSRTRTSEWRSWRLHCVGSGTASELQKLFDL